MKSMEEIRAFFSGDRFALEACGITIDEVAASMAKCSMPITSMHMNANGFAQGGAIYTLCDTTFAVAANAGNALVVSQSANISYLRPGTGTRLYAKAQRISEGKTSCLYQVNVMDENGKLVAFASIQGFRKVNE